MQVVVDVALVVVLVGCMLAELALTDLPRTDITPLNTAVVVMAALPGLLWRRRPVTGLVLAMMALYGVMSLMDIYLTVPFTSMLCGFGCALTQGRRRAVLAGVIVAPFVVAAVWIFGGLEKSLLEIPKNLAFVAAPIIIGSSIHERRAHLRAVEARAEEAERTREEEARRRVGEERLRIARDVHDVVAHAMVAINVQAGVGAHLLERDPERARQTLADIKRVSGEALADLRSTLDAIRTPEDADGPPADDAATPTQPTMGAADIPALCESLRTAGLEVSLHLDDDVTRLPVGISSVAFRIVQEALTNVVRHARGTSALVRLRVREDVLELIVADDGRGPRHAGPPAPSGTGNGLRGMRERAEAAGGTVEAGPREDGGWEVRAALPLGTTLAGVGAPRSGQRHGAA